MLAAVQREAAADTPTKNVSCTLVLTAESLVALTRRMWPHGFSSFTIFTKVILLCLPFLLRNLWSLEAFALPELMQRCSPFAIRRKQCLSFVPRRLAVPTTRTICGQYVSNYSVDCGAVSRVESVESLTST